MHTDKEKLQTIIVTDCGSTTTKALLFEKTEKGWRQTFRGEAPTTVEKPVADVTVGATNAFTEIQELSLRKILKENLVGQAPFLISSEEDKTKGVDLYLSTSSAGGGLQMLVGGIVGTITTESAQRAALGAGAIVLDALSADDGREDYERIERIRHLKPDIVLLAGGIDGGSRNHVVEMAETLVAAAPRPRFGDTLSLPIIYAGNVEAAEEVKEILSDIAQVSVVSNLRPQIEVEDLSPAREAIHEFFLTHVMSHSPGYDKLLTWSPVPIMPTPAAVGNIVRTYAEMKNIEILCADIGGATTDVFSMCRAVDESLVFNRTVSANLGMSYSVANVLIEAGPSNISRWIPKVFEDSEVRDRLRNKMIRPSSIPQTKEDLFLEQAVCREALGLSLKHHKSLAVGLSGVQQQRGIADIFSQTANRYELIDVKTLDLVIGSGGVLSHAPDRIGAALMLLDGFALEGVTTLAVDSIFMMPHLGVLASVHEEAADEIFINDCLVEICVSIVATYPKKKLFNNGLAKVFVNDEEIGIIKQGDLDNLKISPQANVTLKVEPLYSSIDVGRGKGKVLEKVLDIPDYGLIFDGRNRPLEANADKVLQAQAQEKIFNKLELL